MLKKKKIHPLEKTILHPRNKHRGRYDFDKLKKTCHGLIPYVKINEFGDESVDFFNPEAVKMLNKSLLMHFYHLEYWDIPENFLCPPVPGRADYIHYAADILGELNKDALAEAHNIRCLDIGTGANCIYPIIGCHEYKWSFVGSDIDRTAIESAEKIIKSNKGLSDKIEIRMQKNPKKIFDGIIKADEYFDLTICNPPFHASEAEAQSAAVRKLSNLKNKRINKALLNFGGKCNELWCEGGEIKFVESMIVESRKFSNNCLYFTTLISKESDLKSVYFFLEKAKVKEVKTIQMGQGNKISRIVAWTFLNEEEKKNWVKLRWKN